MEFRKYDKIETVFLRDTEGSKKLIDGAWRNETVEYLKDAQWDFTEKVDGTNIRVFWDGHTVTFGGRTDNAQIPVPLVNRLNEIFGTNEAEELFEQTFGEKEVILYGEGYGKKIQGPGSLYLPDRVDFILFDVYTGAGYLKREAVEATAKLFGVAVVPILFSGPLSMGIEYVKTPHDSVVAENGAPMEGLVARPSMELRDRFGARVIVKLKYKDFKELA